MMEASERSARRAYYFIAVASVGLRRLLLSCRRPDGRLAWWLRSHAPPAPARSHCRLAADARPTSFLALSAGPGLLCSSSFSFHNGRRADRLRLQFVFAFAIPPPPPPYLCRCELRAIKGRESRVEMKCHFNGTDGIGRKCRHESCSSTENLCRQAVALHGETKTVSVEQLQDNQRQKGKICMLSENCRLKKSF